MSDATLEQVFCQTLGSFRTGSRRVLDEAESVAAAEAEEAAAVAETTTAAPPLGGDAFDALLRILQARTQAPAVEETVIMTPHKRDVRVENKVRETPVADEVPSQSATSISGSTDAPMSSSAHASPAPSVVQTHIRATPFRPKSSVVGRLLARTHGTVDRQGSGETSDSSPAAAAAAALRLGTSPLKYDKLRLLRKKLRSRQPAIGKGGGSNKKAVDVVQDPTHFLSRPKQCPSKVEGSGAHQTCVKLVYLLSSHRDPDYVCLCVYLCLSVPVLVLAFKLQKDHPSSRVRLSFCHALPLHPGLFHFLLLLNPSRTPKTLCHQRQRTSTHPMARLHARAEPLVA